VEEGNRGGHENCNAKAGKAQYRWADSTKVKRGLSQRTQISNGFDSRIGRDRIICVDGKKGKVGKVRLMRTKKLEEAKHMVQVEHQKKWFNIFNVREALAKTGGGVQIVREGTGQRPEDITDKTVTESGERVSRRKAV